LLAVRLKYWLCLVLLTLVTGMSLGVRPAFANEDSNRKVKSRVAPVYPDLAKRMKVTGSVKVQVVIAPNGDVRSTKVIGGHPLLIDPSIEAVRKWKYEPASGESTQTVEFKFNGND
jgi:TonB family protein